MYCRAAQVANTKVIAKSQVFWRRPGLVRTGQLSSFLGSPLWKGRLGATTGPNVQSWHQDTLNALRLTGTVCSR